MAKTNNSINDFDPNELIRSSAEHEKSLNELQRSIEAIEKRVGDNEKFADTFSKTFETSKKLDKVVVKAVVSLINSHDDVKKAIQHAVKRSDRDWQKQALSKVGLAVWSIALIVIGAVIGHFVQ